MTLSRYGSAGAGLCAVVMSLCLIFSSGCATKKQNTKRTASTAGQRASTNRFDSSIAAEAEKTARTNAAPAKAPDNTAQNKADAKVDSLTPMDQGNSSTDRRITQVLRKSIVSGKDGQRFSFSAKNIKIITINSEVTLRGVVATEAEKTAIGNMARQLSGVRKVNNQLDVKRASR